MEASNYPFCTIDPNVGVVPVPDPVLEKLTKLSASKKTVPAVVEFVDIAGLVAGAHKGEGLGNKFLSHIREVDAIAQVVREFEDPDVAHVHGKIDAKTDLEVINLELIMADLEQVEKRLKNIKGDVRAGDKEIIKENELLEKLKEILTGNKLISATELDLDKEQEIILKTQNLLTIKPQLVIHNVDEENIKADNKGINICAKLESELAEMSENEALEMLKEIGLKQSGLNQFITTAYQALNLISFYTTGEKETRAWTIPKGALAPQAAGVIHTDFEAGFIRAEVIHYQELLAAGSWSAARDNGKIRMEGKEYIMQEGDTVIFHFD